jgi:hypothetical protein
MLSEMLSLVASISIVLAIAFWLLASARFVMHPGERDSSNKLSLSAFTAHLASIAGGIAINGKLGITIAMGSGIVLALLSVIFAMKSHSMIGNRMKAATLLWIGGICLALAFMPPRY